MYVFIGELLPRLVPLGCGVGSAGRRFCAILADTLFVVGVVSHTQVVVEEVLGTVDLLGGLFIDLGGSE
jgi:hypothetical protein